LAKRWQRKENQQQHAQSLQHKFLDPSESRARVSTLSFGVNRD
jgi:hypothetical protein